MAGGEADLARKPAGPYHSQRAARRCLLDLQLQPDRRPASPNGIGGVLVICAETTSTVMLERRLAAQVDRMRRLFEQAPGLIAMLEGPEHRFSFANAAYRRFVGDRELIGRTVGEALPDAAAQGYVQLLDDVFRRGEAFTSAGARYAIEPSRARSTSDTWTSSINPSPTKSGCVTGIFVEGHDVTEQKLAEIALANTSALREQFIAVLATTCAIRWRRSMAA